jgi:hypothetical protein
MFLAVLRGNIEASLCSKGRIQGNLQASINAGWE